MMDRQAHKRLALTVGAVILCGTVIFTWLEGWSFIDSLYFVTAR